MFANAADSDWVACRRRRHACRAGAVHRSRGGRAAGLASGTSLAAAPSSSSFARCLAWNAPNTVVIAADVESVVVTQVQYTIDQVSDAFRAVESKISFALQQSFDVTARTIQKVFEVANIDNLEALAQAIEDANRNNTQAQDEFRQLAIQSNNDRAANEIVLQQQIDTIANMTVSVADIEGLLASQTEAAEVRRGLVDAAALQLAEFRALFANFSRLLHSLQTTNFAFNPPADMNPADLARIMALVSLEPCPLQTLDVFDENRYLYDSDVGTWWGGHLLPLRYWFLVTLFMAIAWAYAQLLPAYAFHYHDASSAKDDKRWVRRRTCFAFGDWWYGE